MDLPLQDPAPFVNHLGMRFSGLGEGWAESELAVEPHHAQAQGVVHAGVLATMADHTAGACASTVAPPGHAVMTVEFKVNLLRAAVGSRLTCRSEVLKAGRTITVAESRIHAHDGERPRLCATATVTLAVVASPSEAA